MGKYISVVLVEVGLWRGYKGVQGHLQSGQANSWEVVCEAECQLKWLLASSCPHMPFFVLPRPLLMIREGFSH